MIKGKSEDCESGQTFDSSSQLRYSVLRTHFSTGQDPKRSPIPSPRCKRTCGGIKEG